MRDKLSNRTMGPCPQPRFAARPVYPHHPTRAISRSRTGLAHRAACIVGTPARGSTGEPLSRHAKGRSGGQAGINFYRKMSVVFKRAAAACTKRVRRGRGDERDSGWIDFRQLPHGQQPAAHGYGSASAATLKGQAQPRRHRQIPCSAGRVPRATAFTNAWWSASVWSA